MLDKIVDIKSDQVLAFSDVICLTETWLKEDLFLQQELQIKGYTLNLNSFGDQKAKGLAMYYKTDVFHVEGSTKHSTIQVSKLSSDSLDVIGVYRSKQCRVGLENISALINSDKTTIIIGDFNVCYNQHPSHPLIKMLLEIGFQQLVTQATHIEDDLIDHIYFRNEQHPMEIDVDLYSLVFSAAHTSV